MPLVLQPAVEADVHRICEIERLAYATNRLSPFLFPGPMPPDAQEKRAERLVIQLHEEPTIRWMKVVDTETGEMAAFAKWDIIEKPKTSTFTRWFGEGCNVEACEEFFGGIHKKRNELMADKPHCLLDLLHTDPKYQRRGAGAMLVQWGVDIADELHIPAYLESSPAGHSLYQKFGFKDIDELVLNPKHTNGITDPSVYFMLRETR